MAGSITNIRIRMDLSLKAQAERLFGELGKTIVLFKTIKPDILPAEINMEDNNAKKRKRHRFLSE